MNAAGRSERMKEFVVIAFGIEKKKLTSNLFDECVLIVPFFSFHSFNNDIYLHKLRRQLEKITREKEKL